MRAQETHAHIRRSHTELNAAARDSSESRCGATEPAIATYPNAERTDGVHRRVTVKS